MMKFEIYDVMINERYAFTVHVPVGCEDIKKYIERRHLRYVIRNGDGNKNKYYEQGQRKGCK